METQFAVAWDVNDDGKMDLVVSTRYSGLGLYLNNGEGNFEICEYDTASQGGAKVMEVLRHINLRTAKPIDVNGDSKMDLVVVHDHEKDGARIGRIDIWKNNGSPDFNVTVVLEQSEESY